MESSTLFRMMSIWDFFSSSESPSMFFSALAMIFICLRMVDLPLSPVPRRRSFVICDFFRKSSFRSFFINLVRFNICKISLILQNLWQTYLYGRPPWRGPCSCPWCTSFAPWGHVIVKLLICTDSHHCNFIDVNWGVTPWHPPRISRILIRKFGPEYEHLFLINVQQPGLGLCFLENFVVMKTAKHVQKDFFMIWMITHHIKSSNEW